MKLKRELSIKRQATKKTTENPKVQPVLTYL